MLQVLIVFCAFCRLLITGCGNVNTNLQNTNAEGAWPWMVAITKRERGGQYIPWCNGVLIDRMHVLSAAHCFDIKDDYSDFLARIGKMNRSEGETYEITCIIQHHRYERDLYYDDIAIVTLSRMVDTPNYNPICLPDNNLSIRSLIGVEVTKTAWGADKPGGIISETLMSNKGLRIISQKDCNMMVRKVMRSSFIQQFPAGVSGDMICSENPTEQAESCGGDSGAPLMYKDENNQWIVVGISAFKYSCLTDAPSGFISVYWYLEWILENTIDDTVVHCTRFPHEDLDQLIVHYDDKGIRARSTANFSCKFNDRVFSGKTESACCRNGNWSSPPPQCKGCGKRLDDYRPHVTEDGNATEGAWPWMVAISIKKIYEPWCSGFLIDRKHVLTAALCFHSYIANASEFEVRIGRVNLLEGDIYNISHIVLHPDYSTGNDISILTLDRQVTTSGYNAICLPDEELSKKNLVGKEAWAAGWKRLSKRSHIIPKMHQIQGIHIMDTQVCNRTLNMISPKYFPRVLKDGFKRWLSNLEGSICTEQKKRGSCMDYIGGPLMYQHINRWYAIGISSHSCGPPEQPVMYTRVSQYLDWIAENTGDLK